MPTDPFRISIHDGLLNQLTGWVLETALEEEMSDHLGYDKHQVALPASSRSFSAGGNDRRRGRSDRGPSVAMTPSFLTDISVPGIVIEGRSILAPRGLLALNHWTHPTLTPRDARPRLSASCQLWIARQDGCRLRSP